MATIYTRAAKGSALTWTEGDANITNLNNAKIENVVEDLTPQLGGNLDVNGNSITSASNGDISITPNGTGSVIIDGNEFPQTQGAAGEVLTADGSGLVEWKLNQTISAQVYNADSVTINKGEPVYVFGAQGANISVKRALNTGDATSAQTLGLANENITAGSTGIVICQGVLKNVNTSTYAAGDALYLGATAGAITTTKPYAPNHMVYLGFVESVNSVSGRIYVRVQNGYELDEIHNVQITTTPSNGQVLAYETSSSLWKPSSIVGGTALTTTVTAGNITLDLDNTAVTPNTYALATITVDQQGRLTAASAASTTGSGAVVLASGPTLTTPTLGVATATSINKVAFTAPATAATLTIADGKTLTASNTLTFTGTDASSVAFGTGGTVLYSGGALGTPSSGTVTNLTGTASININGTVGATTANTGAFTTLTFKDPREAIYDLGTTGGTVAPNVANGSVQKITLNAALTINAFTSPQAGQSLTLIINGGTAYTSITSTMKFAGGVKTLTGTANCIDILSVYYDGTTYYASLNKGFA